MTHWGWYWKYKNFKPRKALCSWRSFNEIDSFEMFKFKEGLEWVRTSPDKLLFEIFSPYKLKAMLLEDDSLQMECEKGIYRIPVEKKPCNYGGYYRFFHCPHCKRRMRKLYCFQGIYLCRKCANLGYWSQRLTPSRRCIDMAHKIENKLEKKGGTIDRKPPRMKHCTFKKLKSKHFDYRHSKYEYCYMKELASYYPSTFAYMKDEIEDMEFDW